MFQRSTNIIILAGVVFANLLLFSPLDAQEQPSITYASGFSGQTGGDQIQNAINEAANEPGRNVVVVNGVGPDSYDPNGYKEISSCWLLDEAITIPSNTLLKLKNAYLLLKDGANDNLLRNSDRSNGNIDISITGEGNSVLDGNASNQSEFDRFNHDNPRARKNLGLRFVNVEDLSIHNLKIKRTNAWGMIITDFEDVVVDNITFAQDGTTHNQDGVDLTGPGNSAVISNITGIVGDDAVALGTSDPSALPEDAGTMEGITIDNIACRQHSYNNTYHRQIRISGSDADYEMRNISINNVSNPGSCDELIRIGSGFSHRNIHNISASNLTARNCEAFFNDAVTKNVSISNVTAHVSGDNPVVQFDNHAYNISVSNISVNGKGPALQANEQINGLSIHNLQYNNSSTDGGIVLNVDARIKNAMLNGINARGAMHLIRAKQPISGTANNLQTHNISSDIYSGVDQLNIRFGFNVPAFKSFPPAIAGSIIRLNKSGEHSKGTFYISHGADWKKLRASPD